MGAFLRLASLVLEALNKGVEEAELEDLVKRAMVRVSDEAMREELKAQSDASREDLGG